MKTLKTVALLCICVVSFCSGQSKVVTITPAMFDKSTGQQYLGAVDGWVFKQGNDTAWAKKDLEPGGWVILKPAQLSGKLADKNGRLECWLRIRIKIDSAFGDQEIDIKDCFWSAGEVYVDGSLVVSRGN